MKMKLDYVEFIELDERRIVVQPFRVTSVMEVSNGFTRIELLGTVFILKEEYMSVLNKLGILEEENE